MMNRRQKVELFEQIRREYEFGIGTIAPLTVTIWHGGQEVACHERCYRCRPQVLELEHDLDALIHKPGALAGSTPLAQWRAAGRWTAAHDDLWAWLREWQGTQEGTRQMIERLPLGRQHGYDRLTRAIHQALTPWRR